VVQKTHKTATRRLDATGREHALAEALAQYASR
jgi:hypothetical protein